MMKIIAAPLPELRDEQHLSLMTDVKKLISEEPAVKLILVEEEPQFSDALAAEVVAEKVASGSEITDSMGLLFALRAKYFLGLELVGKMGLCLSNKTIKTVAVSKKKLMKKDEKKKKKKNEKKRVSSATLA